MTGANKGIGYGICKKLALNGVVVVLTARNEKRGLDAVERLKEFGLSDLLVFHQLDVTDPPSVASLTQFIKTRFGRLDILVYYLHVTIYFPPSFFNLFRKFALFVYHLVSQIIYLFIFCHLNMTLE